MPTANIRDVEIYYEEHGSREPLIMVLGLGQDIATWGFQIEELSKHLRLVVFDNRDSGKSSRCTDNYETETMAQDVLSLMGHLGIERAHLLDHRDLLEEVERHRVHGLRVGVEVLDVEAGSAPQQDVSQRAMSQELAARFLRAEQRSRRRRAAASLSGRARRRQ